MWANSLKDLVLKPLFRRIGTVVAAWLVFGGNWMCDHWQACGLVTEAGANLVVTYLIAVACLAFDLAVSAAERWSVARKAARR